MEDDTVPNEGISFGTKERRKCQTKDRPDMFWASYKEIEIITKVKYHHPQWGAKRILEFGKTTSPDIDFGTERLVRRRIEQFFYDENEDAVFFKSHDLGTGHRKCVTKEELIKLIESNHAQDHRKSRTIYESLRHICYPVTKESVELLFKENVRCVECAQARDLPKTTVTRRPIPATYPNSRWQVDLKKMPPQQGCHYILNVVDCYSRFAFGSPTKDKSAKQIANNLVHFIHLYGAPRILQSDNGKEFNNQDLNGVIEEFRIQKINGRPYHPQSQGRVERFNRTVVEYFQKTIYREQKWPEQLEQFYYDYNNRVNKATLPATPFERFFGRPNFAPPSGETVPLVNLTREERAFLDQAHLDVDNAEETEESEDSGEIVVQKNIQERSASSGENAERGEVTDSVSPTAQNRDMMHPYYAEIFRRSFEQQYPLERFAASSATAVEHFAVGEIVDYRPNPALSAGTAAILHGRWRKGTIISISVDTVRGRAFKVQNDIDNTVMSVNIYQLSKNCIA